MNSLALKETPKNTASVLHARMTDASVVNFGKRARVDPLDVVRNLTQNNMWKSMMGLTEKPMKKTPEKKQGNDEVYTKPKEPTLKEPEEVLKIREMQNEVGFAPLC